MAQLETLSVQHPDRLCGNLTPLSSVYWISRGTERENDYSPSYNVITKSKAKQSRYTPWWRLGGEDL
jgi:hypothetical protein